MANKSTKNLHVEASTSNDNLLQYYLYNDQSSVDKNYTKEEKDLANEIVYFSINQDSK